MHKVGGKMPREVPDGCAPGSRLSAPRLAADAKWVILFFRLKDIGPQVGSDSNLFYHIDLVSLFLGVVSSSYPSQFVDGRSTIHQVRDFGF